MVKVIHYISLARLNPLQVDKKGETKWKPMAARNIYKYKNLLY